VLAEEFENQGHLAVSESPVDHLPDGCRAETKLELTELKVSCGFCRDHY